MTSEIIELGRLIQRQGDEIDALNARLATWRKAARFYRDVARDIKRGTLYWDQDIETEWSAIMLADHIERQDERSHLDSGNSEMSLY